jgi:outer membrane immunogenic protein
VGGFIGGAWAGSATATDLCLTSAAAACAANNTGTYNDVTPVHYGLQDSFAGGGTLGYNWQMPGSQFVLGLENEVGYLRLRGSAVMNPFPVGNSDTVTSTTIGSWYDAYTVRAGYAWDQSLVYAKAGGVSVAYTTGIVDVVGGTTINTTTNRTLTNWAAGGGFEYGIAKNWSLKAEYLYLGVGGRVRDCAQVGGFPPGTIDCSSTKTSGVNTIKVGVNYHFN